MSSNANAMQRLYSETAAPELVVFTPTQHSVESPQSPAGRPFLSVCVPQYNRTSFLKKSCEMLARQKFRDFELCISDDCSTDGREQELLQFLDTLGISYIYHKQAQNTGYDGNLRSSIGLASGQYCLLLGNDDMLASSSTLEVVHAHLSSEGPVAVALTNYQDTITGRIFRRVSSSAKLAGTPRLAASLFRNFSFVSGVILDTQLAQGHATARWDGSEMYQMYLASRLIAAGGPFLAIDTVAVLKDVQVPDERVDSYARRPRERGWPIAERRIPLSHIVRLVADAIAPYAPDRQLERLVERVAWQLLLFTCPYWIVEYRRVQSWGYAAGVCLGMRPGNLLQGISLSKWRRARVGVLYVLCAVCGLCVPTRALLPVEPILYRIAKFVR